MHFKLMNLFGAYRFHFNDEGQLQSGVERVFAENNLEAVRECKLSPGDRVDFFCGGVGVECKVGGSLSEVTRQLHRYAELPEVASLILITSRAKHLGVAREMCGKRVDVHFLRGGF